MTNDQYRQEYEDWLADPHNELLKLRRENAELRRERDEAQRHEREANKGAQTNARVNQLLVADLVTARLHITEANKNHEHFEREWYLRGDEIEALTEQLATARQQVAEVTSERDRAVETRSYCLNILRDAGHDEAGPLEALVRRSIAHEKRMEAERDTAHQQLAELIHAVVGGDHAAITNQLTAVGLARERRQQLAELTSDLSDAKKLRDEWFVETAQLSAAMRLKDEALGECINHLEHTKFYTLVENKERPTHTSYSSAYIIWLAALAWSARQAGKGEGR